MMYQNSCSYHAFGCLLSLRSTLPHTMTTLLVVAGHLLSRCLGNFSLLSHIQICYWPMLLVWSMLVWQVLYMISLTGPRCFHLYLLRDVFSCLYVWFLSDMSSTFRCFVIFIFTSQNYFCFYFSPIKHSHHCMEYASTPIAWWDTLLLWPHHPITLSSHYPVIPLSHRPVTPSSRHPSAPSSSLSTLSCHIAVTTCTSSCRFLGSAQRERTAAGGKTRRRQEDIGLSPLGTAWKMSSMREEVGWRICTLSPVPSFNTL